MQSALLGTAMAATLAIAVDVRQHAIDQVVALFASVPLSAEGWHPLDCGDILVIRGGRVVSRIQQVAGGDGALSRL